MPRSRVTSTKAAARSHFTEWAPRYRAPSIDECHRRADRMLPFQPTTWIDHGRGPYLFSRDAVLEGGVALTDFLSRFGVINYWSYVDIWQNPSGSISSHISRGNIDVLRDAAKCLGTALKSASASCRAPHSRVSSREQPPWRNRSARGAKGGSGCGALEAARSRRLHRLLARNPEVIYGLDGCSFALTRKEVICFDTSLMTYPANFLEPERIDRLRRESGLSLVHSYLCDPRRRGTRRSPSRELRPGTLRS